MVKSSGTTGRQSVINLDKTTSQHQSKALIEIVSDFIGKKRKPMVILDNYETIKNPSNYSARSAAIIGFSIFANERLFSLNNNFEFDFDSFEKFIKKHK